MHTVTIQHLVQNVKTAQVKKQEKVYPPLDVETRTVIPTAAAAYYLNRASQTLRSWACFESGPIRPVRINGRLAWPVDAIRTLLSGGVR